LSTVKPKEIGVKKMEEFERERIYDELVYNSLV
jgi:hypothetical protein